ncbi:unnamed protein product [Rotaria socialis]|uniref:Uncharacterized protein n=1 Tax=Rotaria socialis TaxID=392032 RepID=A0A820WZ31_9BILA|nr:unnamed protein product [Rotaria socialis]
MRQTVAVGVIKDVEKKAISTAKGGKPVAAAAKGGKKRRDLSNTPIGDRLRVSKSFTQHSRQRDQEIATA